MGATGDFHYTVKGSWPFPTDMLRRDSSRAATHGDQVMIDRFSLDYADLTWDGKPVTINLVIPDAGRSRPNTARWRSFGWDVPDDVEFQQLEDDRAKRSRMEKLYASALAKLTPEEIEAVDWFRMARRC